MKVLIMKKSFLKSAVSTVAAAVMAIMSVSAVFAANDYTSEAYNSSNWSLSTAVGATQTLVDGMLKSERTIFRGGQNGMENWTAGSGGSWVATETVPGGITSMYKVKKNNIKTGKAQAKFDVMFNGGKDQKIDFQFDGVGGQTGVQLQKNAVLPLYPNGTYGYDKKVNHDTVEDKQWYTYTITIDLDTDTISWKAVKKDGAKPLTAGSYTIPESGWKSGDNTITKDAVKGFNFVSVRVQDYSDLSSCATYPTSIWYINNVEYDAYTETNYAINRVERTSKISTLDRTDREEYQDKGFALKRLTGIADSENASFITAGYDSDNRMVEAVSTPLANIASDYINVGVTGDKVKAFIMDSKDATPYTTAYDSKTSAKVRINGFENSIQLNGSAKAGISTTVVDENGNSVLKSERTIFRNGRKNYTWNGSQWVETSDDPKMENTYIKLDKSVSDMTISFKVKFAGNKNGAGRQAVSLLLDGSSLPIDLIRSYDGTVAVKHRFSNSKTNVKFDAEMWYDVTLKISNLGESTTFAWTFAKDGKILGTCSASNINWEKSFGSKNSITNTSAVALHSRRDEDLIVTSATDVTVDNTKTTSSVWYIDDFSVEY